MNSECRKHLQSHIRVKLERESQTKPGEMNEWLLAGDQTFDLSQVNSKTLYKFIQRNMERFMESGSLERSKGSGGSNKTLRQTINRIKRLAMNKNRRGNRRVAAMSGVTHTTVQTILKKAGARPFHKRKVQAMTQVHKEKRVQFARWALEEYGLVVNGNTT